MTKTQTPSAAYSETLMSKLSMTESIVSAKLKKNVSWQQIAQQVGVDELWLASACLGVNSVKPELADKICSVLELPAAVSVALQQFPTKTWSYTIPQDPLIYRLYEIVGVYGESIKEIVHEKFGDGIMSAIDYSMSIDKEENPAGNRVVITMNGKFLPYKSW